jgi:hypothetical protein
MSRSWDKSLAVLIHEQWTWKQLSSSHEGESCLKKFLLIGALTFVASPTLAEENLYGTFHGVPASAFNNPAGAAPEAHLWGDGSGAGNDPNDGRLYNRRAAPGRKRAAKSESDWKVDPDTLAYLRDLDPETRLKVLQELPPQDRPRAEKALRKIGIYPLRDALRARLNEAASERAAAAAEPEQTEDTASSAPDFDQAIDVLNGMSSVLSAFSGAGTLAGGATTASSAVSRSAAAPTYRPAPRRVSGSDITGTH